MPAVSGVPRRSRRLGDKFHASLLQVQRSRGDSPRLPSAPSALKPTIFVDTVAIARNAGCFWCSSASRRLGDKFHASLLQVQLSRGDSPRLPLLPRRSNLPCSAIL